MQHALIGRPIQYARYDQGWSSLHNWVPGYRPVGSGTAWRWSPHQKSAGRKREKEEREEKGEGNRRKRIEREREARGKDVLWV